MVQAHAVISLPVEGEAKDDEEDLNESWRENNRGHRFVKGVLGLPQEGDAEPNRRRDALSCSFVFQRFWNIRKGTVYRHFRIYRYGKGQDNPYPAMPWIEAATLEEFTSTDRKYCELSEDIQAALFRHDDGNFYAVEVWCSHQKVSLMNGDLDEYELMCPLHGACFDIRDGKHQSLPAVKPIASYPVKQEDQKLWIEIPGD